jgi:membrane-associated phospholipid phosphatase
MAMVLGSFYLELQGPLFVVAASIAVSRIILAIHFLSDVLAGSAIGMLIRCTCFHFLAYL